MKRETISSTAHKAQLGSSSRATIRKVDHSTVIPTADMDVMHGETSKGVPIVQPYGMAYWPVDQTEEQGKKSTPGKVSANGTQPDDQPKGKSAIGMTSYANGTRSDPSSQNLQDPRHQLMLEDEKDKNGKPKGESKGGKAGDTAMYRTNDPKKLQQLHLTDEGPRLTSIQTQKFALVSEEEQQQSSSSSSGQQSQQQEDGQRPIFKKESDTYIEQTASKTTTKRGAGSVTVEDKSIMNQYEDQKISARVTDKHVHIRFKKFKIWVDEYGCYSTVPIIVKDDPHDDQ